MSSKKFYVENAKKVMLNYLDLFACSVDCTIIIHLQTSDCYCKSKPFLGVLSLVFARAI